MYFNNKTNSYKVSWLLVFQWTDKLLLFLKSKLISVNKYDKFSGSFRNFKREINKSHIKYRE